MARPGEMSNLGRACKDERTFGIIQGTLLRISTRVIGVSVTKPNP